MSTTATPKQKIDKRIWFILGGIIIGLCLICGVINAITPKTAAAPTLDVAAIYTFAAQTAVGGMMPAQTAVDAVMPAQTSEPTALPAPTNPPKADGQTRTNPLPGAEGVDIGGDMRLTVLDVVRPADDTVIGGNMFNATPSPDVEYAIVHIHVECGKSQNDKCDFFPSQVKSVGSDGQIREMEFVAGIPGKMEQLNYEFFGGSKVDGALVFLFPKNDAQVVLFHEAILFGTGLHQPALRSILRRRV